MKGREALVTETVKRTHIDATDRPIEAMVSRAPSPIRTQVANYLRRCIAERQLLPGEVLIEREICELTTASRASVREALRELEAEGLVTTQAGRGTKVASLSPKEAQDIYIIRAELEALAGRLFVLNASEEHIDQLRRAVENVERFVESPSEIVEAKKQFYDALIDGAGNVELGTLLNLMRGKITLMRSTSLSVPGRSAETVREIRDVLAAAERRDLHGMEKACRQHVINASVTALQASAKEHNKDASPIQKSLNVP